MIYKAESLHEDYALNVIVVNDDTPRDIEYWKVW